MIKVIVEINDNEVSTKDFQTIVSILSKCRMEKNFDVNLTIPKEGFKIIGNWIFMSELAKFYYKRFIKDKVISNIRLLKRSK